MTLSHSMFIITPSVFQPLFTLLQVHVPPRRILFETLSKKNRLIRRSRISWENRYQLVCRRHIDLFESE